jgi:hypothetical protein
VNLQAKKRELKQLKSTLKTKLENNNLLKNLLTSQELLTSCQAETSQKRTSKLIENQLQHAKEQFQTQLTTEEINQLCQLQSEITNLEIKLENLQEEKLEAQIEISPK